MTWTAEWRTKGDSIDAVFLLDDKGSVREAFSATQSTLSRFLTQMGDLESWRGESPIGGDRLNSEAWGQLIMARASGGEVLEVEPELFWHGIYMWFRSRGVDYDTPGLKGDSSPRFVPKLQRSSLMDD